MNDKKLNGSADLLARAIRKVFEETSETVRDSVKEDMHEMEKNLSDKIDTTNKTTNENMQAQLAQNKKDIAEMIKARS